MRDKDSLVRQWRLLKYIALKGTVITSSDYSVLCRILNVQTRTVRRDLAKLAQAGLLDCDRVHPHLMRFMATEEAPKVVEAIMKIATDKVKGADLEKCNACEYRFRLVGGKVDMRDFRSHKESHRAAVSQVHG